MPVSGRNFSTNRVDFTGTLSQSEIDSLVANPDVEILQTSEPLNVKTAQLLNDRLFSVRTDVELRLYGFYGMICDLSILSFLPNLHRFAADCLMDATGLEFIAKQPRLESLTVAVFHLKDFQFLNDLSPQQLRSLRLGPAKSKRLSLGPLSRFPGLRQLNIAGHTRDIEVISILPCLEEVGLCSITVDDLDFLKGLKQLWSLRLFLGGTRNLAALKDMFGLKYLELCQIRGLDDISVISTLRGLQFLYLRSLSQVQILPDLSKLKSLRRVLLDTLKGLRDLNPLNKAPALEEFVQFSAPGMEPADYTDVLKHKSLRRILVGFGSAKKNKALHDMIIRAGLDEYHHEPFVFV